MNYKEERMSYPDLCTAAHLLARYPFPENVSAVYRDLGYMAQYLDEAIARIAYDHYDEHHRLFVEGDYHGRKRMI